MTTRPKLHFLFGMPRSGTSFLARALERAPNVAVFGETDFFGRSYHRPGPDGRYDRATLTKLLACQRTKEWTTTTGDRGHPLHRLAPGVYPRLAHHALGQLESPTPSEAFMSIAAAVAEHTGCAAVLEKTPGHLMFVDRIADAFPQAHCIALWREPAGFVRSFLQLDQRNAHPVVRLLGRCSRHTAVAVLLWRAYMNALAHARKRLGSRLLVIAQEELRANTSAVVARAAVHLDIECPRVALDQLSRNGSAAAGSAAPADLHLWLGLLAPHLGPAAAARCVLPPTEGKAALRSMLTLLPASVVLAARVLPQAERPLAYLAEVLRGGQAR